MGNKSSRSIHDCPMWQKESCYYLSPRVGLKRMFYETDLFEGPDIYPVKRMKRAARPLFLRTKEETRMWVRPYLLEFIPDVDSVSVVIDFLIGLERNEFDNQEAYDLNKYLFLASLERLLPKICWFRHENSLDHAFGTRRGDNRVRWTDRVQTRFLFDEDDYLVVRMTKREKTGVGEVGKWRVEEARIGDWYRGNDFYLTFSQAPIVFRKDFRPGFVLPVDALEMVELFEYGGVLYTDYQDMINAQTLARLFREQEGDWWHQPLRRRNVNSCRS